MAEQPRILRSLRLVDAVALTAVAVALFAAPAQAAVTVTAAGFTDPVIDGPALALHRPGGLGELRAPNGTSALPGNHPAVGGGRTAWIDPTGIVVSGVTTVAAAGADAIAVSASYVAWRAGKTLNVASLDPATGYAARTVLGGNVGRPALSGNLLVFDIDGRIESIDLATGVHALLRRQARAQLRGPSVYGVDLAYVIATRSRQQVRSGRCARSARAATRRSTARGPPGAATPATRRAASRPRATSTSRCGSARRRASTTPSRRPRPTRPPSTSPACASAAGCRSPPRSCASIGPRRGGETSTCPAWVGSRADLFPGGNRRHIWDGPDGRSRLRRRLRSSWRRAHARRRSNRPRTGRAARLRASTHSPRRRRSTCWQAGATPFDAAVAAAGVLGVVEPYSCGIGGGGFMVLRDGDSGRVTTIDSRARRHRRR